MLLVVPALTVASGPTTGDVTLTLCPSTLALAEGASANVTGDAFNEADQALMVEPVVSWVGANASTPAMLAGWHVSSTVGRFLVGAHGYHTVVLHVVAPPASSGASFDGTVQVTMLDGSPSVGWAPLRFAVSSANATAPAANDTSCVRGMYTLAVFPPASPPARSSSSTGGVPFRGVAPVVGVVAGLGVFALAWAWLVRDESRWLRVVAFVAPLFTRLQPSELLKQDVRERVYMAIQDRPGVHFTDLRRELALSTGVATHHLRVLERNRLVTSRREGRHRSYYPLTSRLPDPTPPPLNKTSEEILRLVTGEGEVRFADLPLRVGTSKSTVSYNVKILADRGLVELVRAGDGRFVVRSVAVRVVRTNS